MSMNTGLVKNKSRGYHQAMKSRFTSLIRIFLIVVFICAISVGTATAEPGGRLVVLRSPIFGWNIVLNLKIDGRTVANVVQGRRFDHFVPPGRHVLTVSAVPNSYYSEPTSSLLNVRAGHTYAFTGAWDGSNRVVLIPSSLPPGQSY
jgi:hypothetical protein